MQICFLLMVISFLVILKMDEINKSGLSEQKKFRLSEITEIENYFYQEINQQKTYSKKLSRYVTIFDYIGKILIILSATTGGISIISFTTTIGAPVGIASASFTISQASNDMEISHNKFITILNEKDKYEMMKYNLIGKNEDEKQENIKLSNISNCMFLSCHVHVSE